MGANTDPNSNRSRTASESPGFYAVITGASRGIGRYLAEGCAGRGWNLVLVALPDSGLKKAAAALSEKYGVRTLYREADLTSRSEPDVLFRWVRDRKLPVNLLINNAGKSCSHLFQRSTPSRNQEILDLNVTATIQLTRLFLPELMSHPKSYLLNVASLAAFQAVPGKALYGATKACVLNFSRALRKELSASTVSVSVLCPGGVYTNRASRKNIRDHGFFGRISAHKPDFVAEYALEQMLNGREIIIPGRVNRLFLYAQKLVPSAVVCRLVYLRNVVHLANRQEQTDPSS
jgi:short-subunit dehydrogenase